MRKFQVRIGINANTDNLIIDINGNKNIAGAGITEAQRIMDQGNGGNIFVGRSVYEHLRQREWYLGKFRKSSAIIKHKQRIETYQFIDPSIPYLNSEDPKESNLMKLIRTKKEKWKEKKDGKEKKGKEKDKASKSPVNLTSVSSLFKKGK